jgi:hypothetical protein
MKEVRVNIGTTLNLGNFESLRIEVGISDDVRPGETFDAALNRVYDKVERYITTKVNEERAEIERGN